MLEPLTRRQSLGWLGSAAALAGFGLFPRTAEAVKYRPHWKKSIDTGLQWVAKTQSRRGHWDAGNAPTAMTALAGIALIGSGSTTTQGPYARVISRAVDFLIGMSARRVGGQIESRHEGLIGDPFTDHRYTYGHGFSMLFLSQVLGEEEDERRRAELTKVLTKAVEFSIRAQTRSGGWGYVSAKDGNDFDEGSTTITQVQGLRGCRNAGIPVPKEAIENAKKYIYDCQNGDGGISYSSTNRGSSRGPITAAALACLYNAGEYDEQRTAPLHKYCKQNLYNIDNAPGAAGHWHYAYMYYAQVVYRVGGEDWRTFRDKLYDRIVREQTTDGSWQGSYGPIYVTACNLIMLQLDRGILPIYQR